MITIKEIIKFLKKIKNEEDFEKTNQLEFKAKCEEVDKILEEKGEVCFMDNANISMIVLKNKRVINLALAIFGNNLEFSEKSSNFSYKIEPIETEDKKDKKYPVEIDYEICSNYSGEYLQIVLELCKYGDPKIFLRRDYPLKVELEEIGVEFILAPQILN